MSSSLRMPDGGGTLLSVCCYAARAFRSVAILLSAAVLSHAAMVTVTPTVTNIGGGMYNYSYSISYTGVDDAFLIDIGAPAVAGAVTNIMTPSGFTSQFDSGLGLVSFLENTSSFVSTATSGFSFNSPDAPGADAFTATILSLSLGSTYTMTGATTGPGLGSTLAPEPSFLYLLAVLAPASWYLKRRKLGSASSALKTTTKTEAIEC